MDTTPYGTYKFSREKKLKIKLGSPPSSACTTLSLTIIINSSYWWAEVVELRKISTIEILAPSRSINCLPTQLSKQHEQETVDSHWRSRTLVTHYLLSYIISLNLISDDTSLDHDKKKRSHCSTIVFYVDYKAYLSSAT